MTKIYLVQSTTSNTNLVKKIFKTDDTDTNYQIVDGNGVQTDFLDTSSFLPLSHPTAGSSYTSLKEIKDDDTFDVSHITEDGHDWNPGNSKTLQEYTLTRSTDVTAVDGQTLLSNIELTEGGGTKIVKVVDDPGTDNKYSLVEKEHWSSLGVEYPLGQLKNAVQSGTVPTSNYTPNDEAIPNEEYPISLINMYVNAATLSDATTGLTALVGDNDKDTEEMARKRFDMV